MAHDIRIGTAGWSFPRTLDVFPAEGSGLERYAAVFNSVEINSSFYRPHQRKTYERWAGLTPAGFRFAVKVPRTITHARRLVDCGEPLARFLEECGGLGDKLGPLLIQLPPSLAFDAGTVEHFLRRWRQATRAATVLEPRHATWFEAPAQALLQTFEIARVAADPAVVPAAAQPGGWSTLAYRRLHGSPAMYATPYDDGRLEPLAEQVASETRSIESWCVFDNTQFGAATTDALRLMALTAPPPVR
ncbi:DUF72 domain-containing protein [Caulobacter sp. BE254]|uniref:DUF72 domain-containing protein n=1 Tax=Caulobacter sp. BE254 TaxID=2817720 RepID=UPI00285E82DB|nr:DUF72 domain-containing protein [Caulobacter sp. BE254]MDR7117949.1 uncharacterized protein YecE (DUF72 family) [Caulobacter sp. BE254]